MKKISLSKSELYGNLTLDSIKNNILPKYNLENSIVEYIKFKDTNKQRAVYKITKNNISYCLKKVYYDAKKLCFIYSAIEWWNKNNINVTYLLATKDNSRYASYKGLLFILTPWIEGERCDYNNTTHLISLIKNLASMHKYSIDFFPISIASNVYSCDNLYLSLSKHANKLEEYSNKAMKTNDKFSIKFLNSYSKNRILSQLSSSVAATIKNDNLTKALCHGDYVNKNIIFTKMPSKLTEKISIIDFDKVSIDYVGHDIAYAFRRLLKRESTDWNFNLFLDMMYEYNNIFQLNLDDYKYIFAYLAFPQKFWRISRDYYNNIEKCNKETFNAMLIKSTSNLNSHFNFCCKFKIYMENKFNIVM